MSEWGTKPLVDLTDLITCGVAKRPEYVESGIPFLSAKNVKNGKVIWKNYRFVSQETHRELTKKNKPKFGDILYTRVGSFGEAAVVDKECDFSVFVSLTLIKLKPELLNHFLKYYLNSPKVKSYASSSINGVGVGNLNVGTVRKFPVPVPPLAEQKRIVAILDEAFVAIDRAKEIAEKNLANAKELFESFLSKITDEKQPLGDFVEIKTGKLNANAAVEGGKYPFFTCSRDRFAIDHFAFDCDAVLLAGNNASGDFNVKHYIGKFNAYQRTYVITVADESKLLSRFLYFQLINSLKELKKSSVGANTRFLKIGMIQDLKICVPEIVRQTQLLTTIEDLQSASKQLETIYTQKLDILDELKQSILQKAFTGQLTANSPELEAVP